MGRESQRTGIFEKTPENAPVLFTCKTIARRFLTEIQEEGPPQKPTMRHFDPAFCTTRQYSFFFFNCLSYPVSNTLQLKLKTQIFLPGVGYSVAS